MDIARHADFVRRTQLTATHAPNSTFLMRLYIFAIHEIETANLLDINRCNHDNLPRDFHNSFAVFIVIERKEAPQPYYHPIISNPHQQKRDRLRYEARHAPFLYSRRSVSIDKIEGR